MRRRNLPVTEQVTVSKLFDPEAVVARDGPKCAAWLVRKHRRRIRREGAMPFTIDVNQRTPPWFLVAMQCLRRRAGWNVVVTELRGTRTYRVEWLGKLRNPRREVRSWLRN